VVGWDKGSLTEQQTKGTVTTMVSIRRIHITKQQNAEINSHRPLLRTLPSRDCLHTAQLPPTRAQHGGTWYGIPCSVRPGWVSPPGCVPCWLLVKIYPVLAELRTRHKHYAWTHRFHSQNNKFMLNFCISLLLMQSIFTEMSI